MSIFSLPSHSPLGLHLDAGEARIVQWRMHGSSRTPHVVAVDRIGESDLLKSDTPPTKTHVTALENLVRDYNVRGREAIVSLGPGELFVQNVRLPQMPEEEFASAVWSEASERVPFPLEEADLRYLQAGQVRVEGEVKSEVIVFVCKHAVIENLLSLTKQAGLDVMRVDAGPMSLLRAGSELSPCKADEFRVQVDCGRSGTTVLFSCGSRLLFTKFLPCGGDQLDAAVADLMKLSHAEAATMRRQVNDADELNPDDALHQTVIDAIRKPLDDLGNELELCLRYFRVTFRSGQIRELLLSGTEASPWLSEFLGSRLSLEHRVFQPFETAGSIDDALRKRGSGWTTAVGLSLATELSPDRVKKTKKASPLATVGSAPVGSK
ncbi:pilus assembly protein PilM [Calycomorphotria hydatis]|uniref:Competence protein A n=1 Tax=Calycomorphotria hydatis TaxID=2528027 RepID=A0A517TF26_9PLAN|nr:pilus assembly protein PilM [Calycomorphotria hydatis]QDT66973.1 Competence protein A [Calycomorphotria hydatis]